MRPVSDPAFNFKSVMTKKRYRPSYIDYNMNAYVSMVYRNAQNEKIAAKIRQIRKEVEKAEKEKN